MINSNSTLLGLIKDYIACSKYMCDLLCDYYGIESESILRARRIGEIPPKGSIEGRMSFEFHGGGCYFEFEKGTIDIDFGPNGRCDGFDRNRLFDFLMTSEVRSVQYQQYTEENQFMNSFELLIKNSLIICPNWYPNPTLYYLKESV